MTKIISPIPAIAKKATVPAGMLSREEIAFLRDLPIASTYPVMQRALDAAEAYLGEPARIEAARQEGYREGAEAARQVALHWLASLETDRDRATSTLAHAEAAQMNQRVCGIAIVITAISALSPAPAEPGDGWIDWRGNEVEGTDDGPPIPKGQEYSIRSRAGHELTLAWPDDELLSWNHEGGDEDVVAYRIGKTAEPSAPVAAVDGLAILRAEVEEQARAYGSDAYFPTSTGVMLSILKRISALEAENAKLRERIAELEDGLRPLAKIGGEIDQYVPQLHDEDGTSVAIGHLRRARALLQGGPDAG